MPAVARLGGLRVQSGSRFKAPESRATLLQELHAFNIHVSRSQRQYRSVEGTNALATKIKPRNVPHSDSPHQERPPPSRIVRFPRPAPAYYAEGPLRLFLAC